MNPTVIPRDYAWVSLRVADLERSVGWYTEVLDLAPMATNVGTCAVDAVERFCYMTHTESLLVVRLHHDPALEVDGRAGDRLGLRHVAIRVHADDLDALREQLENAGRQPGPVVSRSYGRWFEIADPDGNAVRFFAPNQPCELG
jgi:catechol 2,3-dioxygenase-like lactoylglutathione lyase family enzyme